MDDETYIKCDLKQLPGPKFYISIVCGRVSNKFKYKSLDKFCKKLLLWQPICSCSLRSQAFVTLSTLNSGGCKLDFCHFIEATMSWPDIASCHYSKKTVEWYNSREIKFIPKSLNPPNCPQFRLIEKF